MQLKKSLLGLLCLVLLLSLAACKSGADQGASSDAPVITTDVASSTEAGHSSTVRPSDSGIILQSSSATEELPTIEEDLSLPCVKWAVHFSSQIPVEAQLKVKKILQEKEVGFRIEFSSAPYDGGEEYAAWLAKQKAMNSAPDILSSSAWDNASIDAAAFVKDQFLPLSIHLKTEEWTSLREAYAPVEWEKTAVDGDIYVLPRRPGRLDSSVYLYINDNYLKFFDESFDGTYVTLRAIYDKIGDDRLNIALFGAFTTAFPAMYGGYQRVLLAPYHAPSDKFTDILALQETKDFFSMIHRDMQKGILAKIEDEKDINEHTFAYIRVGKGPEIEGYTERIIKRDLFVTMTACSYGVLRDSPQKDLAVQVLAECYSDPRIASLLTWGYEDADEWNRMTDYLNSFQSSKITGFIPALSDEQLQELRSYSASIDSLYTKFWIVRNNETILNPDYDSFLDTLFDKRKDHEALFDELNRQLESWKEKNKQ